MLRLIVIVGGTAALSFAAFTYLALEANNVIVVETIDPDTLENRHTHIWYVIDAEHVLLEAGHPDNPWVKDLTKATTLRLLGEGLDGSYRFTLHGASSHAGIRTRMREKYGWRDWWVDLLFDTSRSVMVEAVRIGR